MCIVSRRGCHCILSVSVLSSTLLLLYEYLIIVFVCARAQNYVRVVEVWWDDYKDYFYASRPETLTLAYGDISDLKRFRYKRTSNYFYS